MALPLLAECIQNCADGNYEGGVDMDLKRPYEVIRHKETLVGRFTIVKDTILINGAEYPYSYEKVGDCVCVLPIIGDDVILIWQYRHSLNMWFYEIPAGGLDGEVPETAARRELLEETGYVAEKMVYLGKYPVSQGTSTAIAHLYIANCGKNKEQDLDAAEIIQVKRVSQKKFSSMIEKGEFKHMVGIVAWYLYQQHYKEK